MDPVIKSDSSGYPTDILDRLEYHGYAVNKTFIKHGLQSLVQTLMDIEVSQILDANRYERSTTRRAYRNGYRATIWNTPLGDIELGIPKLRRGTYYPEWLLNDDEVADTLVRLIKMMIVYGIDEVAVAESLSRLNLFPLSAYEIHQICDGLHDAMSPVKDISDIEILEKHLPLHQRKYLLQMRRPNANHRNEINLVDTEFWRDFTRRMSQAGLIVEDHQSVLSAINPYARLDLHERESIFQLSFARHIHSLYEDRLIA